MAGEDYAHGWRPDKSYRQDRGGVSGFSGPFEAEVMSTVDPTHGGRIEVWIPAFGDESTKNDPSSWITARYLSPFYGITPHKTVEKNIQSDFEENGHAYGMWANVPDPGVKVLVVFSNGERNKCYYIGFIPETQMNQMVPAIGARENVSYSNNPDAEEKCSHAERLPTTEQDKAEASMKDANFGSKQKPIHSVVASQMWKQGTVADTERGPISSSAQRESPSYVFGISTPGRPIYVNGLFGDDIDQQIKNGASPEVQARMGGHTFVMDDGTVNGEDRLVRIRTAAGHQITFSDSGDFIYLQLANGQAWFELGSEGTIDGWAANSINFRAGGDINLHADKQVNISALEKVNIYSSKAMTVEAEENLVVTGKQDLTLYSTAKIGLKSDGTIALDAGGNASVKSGGAINLKGSTIGLNDGAASSVTAPQALTLTDYPDAILNTATVGWELADSQFKSVVSRAPTHEPWDGHNSGVPDVKQPGGS